MHKPMKQGAYPIQLILLTGFYRAAERGGGGGHESERGFVARVSGVGRDIEQGAQREGAIGEARVRHIEARLGDHLALDPQHIEVHRPRTPRDRGRPDAPEGSLNRERSLEDFAPSEVGLDKNGRVQVIALRRSAGRFGLVDRRDRDDAHRRIRPEALNRRGDGSLAITEVRPNADNNTPHSP